MLSRMLTRSQMALLCLGLFLALALCGAWQAFAWGRTQLDTGALVCADTLRLHIRAESDSIASQSAKLHVRDAVLAYLDTACPAQSKPEAIAWAAQHLFELQLTARHALAELNIRTPVRVQLVNMYFATRRYASGTPARRAVRRAAHRHRRRHQAATGGACSTRACAALPAAAMPSLPKTTLCAGSTSSGSGWWNGCSSAPPAGRMWCLWGNARHFCRIACGERSV